MPAITFQISVKSKSTSFKIKFLKFTKLDKKLEETIKTNTKHVASTDALFVKICNIL